MSDMGSLIARYPAKEFSSPFRSTIPLLSLVKDGQPCLEEILSDLGLSGDADLHFEFKVSAGEGRGKPSHTDLMVQAPGQCLAIEAKWTEPPYPTVKKWLGRVPTDNRSQVMSGWLSLIKRFGAPSTEFNLFHDIVYQTIHRAASACATADRPQLTYLQFSSARRAAAAEKHREDLNCLYAALGPASGLKMGLVEVVVEPTDAFAPLAKLPKNLPQTSAAVRAALTSATPLFRFAAKKVWRPS